MQEVLISFETAKLAKEKGFNEQCEFVGRRDLDKNDNIICIPERLFNFIEIRLVKTK